MSKRTDLLDNDCDQALEKFTECYPNFNPSGITKFVKLIQLGPNSIIMSKTNYEKLEKSAPKDWQEVKLGKVVMFKRGYDLSKAEMQDGNIPVAGS